jgi:hypothetical protein|tara:strand:+ start:17 stop:688 length:672 start_codon:yes stop_codon:yes gene_type:complete
MKTVIIALPGREYSGNFLKKWSETLMVLTQKGYKVALINDYSSFVPFSRMKTLGLDVMRGATQVPYDGEMDYDVWVTIDSDILFTPDQVIELIEDTDKYPVVSGLYRMTDLKHYAAVKDWDVDYFKKHGTFEFLKVDELDTSEKHMKVAYNGMGFFACRKGVIENLKYPYFSYPLIEMETEDGTVLRDMCSEDVAFCKNLTDAGYDVIVNTSLRVGHEKTLVI